MTKKIQDQKHIYDSPFLQKITKIIAEEYGFSKAEELAIPVDKNGDALPLYTYPAIEYLSSLDFSGKNIFEFGSGQSTLYWLLQGAKVVSVENNIEWIENIAENLKEFPDFMPNHQHIFADNAAEYADSILNFPDFDVIVIDGSFSRYLCAKKSLLKIKKDGLLILDNSDWFPNTAAFLRDNLDFIQVDFYGLRPSRNNAAVTSIFFSREFNSKSKTERQPNFAIGGRIKHSKYDY
ncbi:MAG: putative O-methyltransferase YrrM [Rickettsiales bacterium]|jgi:predicted O-methyltransferase YrrM